MHPLRQAIWGDIWKHTVEKSQTNATSVIMHPIRQMTSGNIWKHTVEKSQTNANYASMHLLGKALWGHIWKHTVGKSQTREPSSQFKVIFENSKHWPTDPAIDRLLGLRAPPRDVPAKLPRSTYQPFISETLTMARQLLMTLWLYSIFQEKLVSTWELFDIILF